MRPMKPFSTSAPDRYCRLLPPWQPRPTAGTDAFRRHTEALQALVATMVDDKRRVCQHFPPHWPEKLITAGYTYFGQFLHHDLTDDSSSLDEALRLAPEEIRNDRLPRFDLSNLYGDGPFAGRHTDLYEPGDVRLRVGPKNGTLHSFDLATSNGSLLIADRRASENVILRQITAFFARLHNMAVEQFRPEASDNPQKLFARARRQMSWQFQRLIYEDYLPRVLDPDVYRTVFVENSPRVQWQTFSIPVEFSAAAMRFGHSMVRAEYFLSRTSRDLTLLELANRSRDPRSLEPEWAIEWGQFFQNASADSQAITVRPLNAKITAPLHRLPLPALHVFNLGAPTSSDGTINLPLLTLLRGVALALPSGQAAACAFGEPELNERELTCDCAGMPTAQGEILRAADLLHETPLFFYILKESEVRAAGNHLGRTGSHIVAEVFHAARRYDPNSYVNRSEAREAWPQWELSYGRCVCKSLSALFTIASQLN
jgi:hypothetical protein